MHGDIGDDICSLSTITTECDRQGRKCQSVGKRRKRATQQGYCSDLRREFNNYCRGFGK